MGSFQQHVTCSTVTGIVIGGLAYQAGLSLPTCMLGGGLCSMAGMLPDIDSDTSRSFQECIYLAAGLSAVLWVHRLLQFSLSQDVIILHGAGMFLFVRFVIGEFIKKMTAHRGMFHSIPAAVLTGEIVFFLSAGTTAERVFKAFAITAGYLSHLILDEYCSIDSTGKTLRLKKSFGTALKFIDTKRMPVTLCLYALVIFIGMTALRNPELVEQFDTADELIAAEQPLTEQKTGSEQGIMGFLKNLESKATAYRDERQAAIQREAAEFLAQREQAAQNPEVQPAIPTTQPQTNTTSRRRRYTGERMFTQNTSANPAPISDSTSYQMTTLRNGETPPGIPGQENRTTPIPNTQTSQPYAPVYTPPQITDQFTNEVQPASTASPLGIIGNDFGARNRNFALPKPAPAPIMIPSK